MAKRATKKPKVSIVVPIYNVERYLRECLDSILNQTLKDLEIILIDDGSPDNCGKIIDEYAKRDKRIVAIHQINSGYSKTVNRGIAIARGEYIGIIESDDWIESDMYERLYKDAKKNRTDVTKGLFYFYNSLKSDGIQNVIYANPHGVDLRFAPDHVFTVEDWPKIIAFHASVWSSIYKAEFIKKIKFVESAGASYQDFPFMVEVLCKAKRITVVKKPFVHWRNDNDQDNSTSACGAKLLNMGRNSLVALDLLKKYKKLEPLKETIFMHFHIANYPFFERVKWKYKKEYYKLISEIFKEIKDDKDFKYTYFSAVERREAGYFMTKHGYARFVIRHFIHQTKTRLINLATFFLPSYRMIRFTKDQNMDIMSQNNFLMNEIFELRGEIKKLQEKK